MRIYQLLLLLILPGAAFSASFTATDFVLATNLPTGQGPISVQAADFNGDGLIDLVSANESDGTLTVLTNKGRGVFAPASTNIVGNLPQFVLAADVNGDGKPDLVAVNGQDDTLTVLTNNGHGVFKQEALLNVGSFPTCVAAADFNGDGRMDLACVNNNDGTVTIYTNAANRAFVQSALPKVGSAPQFIVAADFNGDGKMDLAVANQIDGTVSILTNNGTGRFTLASAPNAGGAPVWLALADVNFDGRLDLLVADSVESAVTVLTNGGGGRFFAAGTIPLDSEAQAVAAVDLNGDGVPDLAVAEPYSPDQNELLALTSDGHNRFARRTQLAVGTEAGASPWAIACADLTGDGRLDLVTANLVDNTLTIATNAGPAVLNQSAYVASSGFRLTVHGIPGQAYGVEVSTNLQNWSLLQSRLLAGPSWQFMDLTATGGHRFYRTVQLRSIPITGFAYQPKSGFQVTVGPAPGAQYVLEASSDLVNWTAVKTNLGASAPWTYLDTTATNFRSRLYRLATP